MPRPSRRLDASSRPRPAPPEGRIDSARRALLESEERFKILVDSVKDYALCILDPAGTVMSWNAGAERIFGYPENEVRGRPFAMFYASEDAGHGLPARDLEQAVARGRLESEGWRVRRDGSVLWAHTVLAPLRDDAGGLRGFSQVTRDVTERRRQEEALRSSEARLARIIASALDAIVAMDAAERVVLFNAAAERIFGCPAAEALGSPIARFIPEWRGHEQGEVLPPHGRRASGEPFPIEGSVARIEVGGRPFFTLVVRDITDRRRADEERQQLLEREREARRDAEAASRTKDEFLAVISHELRTPLTAMLGWVRLLRAGKLDDASRSRALETVERAARQQAMLIEDLLDVSRIVSGLMRLEPSRVDLRQVILAAIDTLRLAADAKGIKIETFLDPEARGVRGDPDRLQQVVWNLLSNAIKFTPRGGRVWLVGSSRVDLQACKLEYSIVSPK